MFLQVILKYISVQMIFILKVIYEDKITLSVLHMHLTSSVLLVLLYEILLNVD